MVAMPPCSAPMVPIYTGRVMDGNWGKSKFINVRPSPLCLRPLEQQLPSGTTKRCGDSPDSISYSLIRLMCLLVGLYDALLTWKQYLLPAWTWSKYLMRWHNTCSSGEGLTLTLYQVCNIYTPGRALVGRTYFSERCLRSYSHLMILQWTAAFIYS